MFKKIAIIAMLALLGPPLALAQEPERPTLVSSPALGIQLELPPDWFDGSQTPEQLVLASRGPASKQAVVLISRQPARGRSLRALATTTENYVFTRMAGYVDEMRNIQVAGAPAYLMIYQGQSQQQSKGWRQFYRVVVLKENDFLTFQAVMDKEDFASRKGSLESMIKSITWKTTNTDESR